MICAVLCTAKRLFNTFAVRLIRTAFSMERFSGLVSWVVYERCSVSLRDGSVVIA